MPTSQGLQLKAPQGNNQPTNEIGSQILRQIVIPELTKEVNEGKNFAQLRQVYNSLILATWYKKKIKDSILEQVYANKNKVAGILSSPNALVGDPQYIYQQYLKAFKKGVFNYIKEDIDPTTQETVPRKYFSGGFGFNRIDRAMTTVTQMPSLPTQPSDMSMVTVDLKGAQGAIKETSGDSAMKVKSPFKNVEQMYAMAGDAYDIFNHLFSKNNLALRHTKEETIG